MSVSRLCLYHGQLCQALYCGDQMRRLKEENKAMKIMERRTKINFAITLLNSSSLGTSMLAEQSMRCGEEHNNGSFVYITDYTDIYIYPFIYWCYSICMLYFYYRFVLVSSLHSFVAMNYRNIQKWTEPSSSVHSLVQCTCPLDLTG